MSTRKNMETYSVWEYEYKIPNTSLTLKGHSRGSEKTGFYIPELKLFLDAGIQSYFNPNYIFITHCHSDHSFALPMLLTCITTQPKVYVPKEHLKLFENFNDSYHILNSGAEYKCNSSFIGIDKQDVIELEKKYFIKVIELDHTVPAYGYGLWIKKEKLKSEFINLSSNEIKELKKKNITLTQTIQVPQFAFVCDTSIKVFELNPELLMYPTIIIECTFIDEKTIDIAKESKHIHWYELKPIVKNNPDILFILIHFSIRYSDIVLEDKPENVIIWKN